MELPAIADWAVRNGFSELEIGASVPLDEELFSRIIAGGKIKIGALIYCRNPLLPGEEGAAFKKGVIERLRLAGRLGIPKLITSTGIDRGWDWDTDHFDFHDGIRKRPIRSMDRVADLLNEYLAISESAGTKICLETCPVMGNIAISPYLIEILFDRIPDKRLGLCYDPSHLVWEMMDPYDPILQFRDRIYHVHGKDTEINRERLNKTGILSDFSWWRYRLPGLGEINWNKLVSNLYEAGYDGVISIEHEDPVWEGSPEKIQTGLLIGKRIIEKTLYPEKY
ncbi:MAG: sugar phosphate isomerase/epimerase [Treponema sp.]|nr:sugar phosphate isomerase/epimerase [Treponema sp.]